MKRSGLKRRKRLRSRSPRTVRRDEQYAKLRRVWLPGRVCEAKHLEIFLGSCSSPEPTDVHHKMGRSRAVMLNVATWAALCRRHHSLVTDNPSIAYGVGLSLHRYVPVPALESGHDYCGICGRVILWTLGDDGASIPEGEDGKAHVC